MSFVEKTPVPMPPRCSSSRVPLGCKNAPLILSSPPDVQITSMSTESRMPRTPEAACHRPVQSLAGPVVPVQEPQQLVLRRDFTVRTPIKQRSHVCNSIVAESKNTFVVNELNTFVPAIEKVNLSSGGLKMLHTPNAGGNSVSSEVMSFEVVRALYGAELVRTEMEIDYRWYNYSITDYSVKINDQFVGVSVARAMKFRGLFNLDDAKRLLTKKLKGVIRSTENACGPYRWKKQILHLFAEQDYVVDILRECYNNHIEESVRHDTVVVVSVCTTKWIYYDKRL